MRQNCIHGNASFEVYTGFHECKKYMCMTKIISLAYDPAWQSTGVSECACRPFSSWGLLTVQAMHPQVSNNIMQEQSSTTRKERKKRRTSPCPVLNTKDILSNSSSTGGLLCFVSVHGYHEKMTGWVKIRLHWNVFCFSMQTIVLSLFDIPTPVHIRIQYAR